MSRCLRWRSCRSLKISQYDTYAADPHFFPHAQYRLLHRGQAIVTLVVSTDGKAVVYSLSCGRCSSRTACDACGDFSTTTDLRPALEPLLPHDVLTSALEADLLLERLHRLVTAKPASLRRTAHAGRRARAHVAKIEKRLRDRFGDPPSWAWK